MSRNEEILRSILADEEYEGIPRSRMESKLMQLSDHIKKYDDSDLIADKTYLTRIQTLDDTKLASDNVIETAGIPVYVSENDFSNYAVYGINETGWYIFVRINAPHGVAVDNGFSISGADKYITPQKNAKYVDVAIRFDASAASKTVDVNWGELTEIFVFRSTDLAVRNLDQRVTFYVYDISDYTTWEYELTSDETFAEDTNYYILSNGEYKLAEITPGNAIPANTYYKHSKVIIEGFPRNISYTCDIIDCPMEIILPEVDGDGYGAWFEIQMTFTGSFSVTLTPPEGVRISKTFIQTPAAGINILNCQYHLKDKVWLIANNKWTIG